MHKPYNNKWFIHKDDSNILVPDLRTNSVTEDKEITTMFDRRTKTLTMSQSGFSFDDHALVQFECSSVKEAEFLMDKIIKLTVV